MEAAFQLDGCPECERLRELLTRCSDDLVKAQGERNALTSVVASQEGTIRRLRKKVRDDTVSASEDVKRVYDFWVEHCVQEKDRSKCKLGPANQKLIAKWLNHFSADELCKAIEGVGRWPYVVKGPDGRARRWMTGKPEGRFAGLSTILKDENRIPYYIELADRPYPTVKERVEQILPEPSAKRVIGAVERDRADWSPHEGSLDRIIRVLCEQGYEVSDRPNSSGEWVAQCPCHEDTRPSLHLTEKDDGKVLAWCFSCSSNLVDVLKALGLVR